MSELESKQKPARVNYRKLADEGKSPVQCGGCRYAHNVKRRGQWTVEKRCYLRFSVKKGKDSYGHPKGDANLYRYVFTDSEYSCGHGLPVVVSRTLKSKPVVSQGDLDEHLKATGQIDGDMGEEAEAQDTKEAASVPATSANPEEPCGYRDEQGIVHHI